MPRHTIAQGVRRRGQAGLAARGPKVERQAGRLAPGRLHHHRHPRRQHDPERSTRSGATGGSRTASPAEGRGPPRTRPARRATTGTSTPTATSRRPSNKDKPALVAGVWMGNSDNSPNDGKLSLDTSAPLWSAILSDVSKGLPIEGFSRVRPKGLVTATVDAFTGMKPGGATRRATSRSCSSPARSRRRRRASRPLVDVDASSAACCGGRAASGPMVTRSFLDFSRAESGFRAWQRADAAGRRARRAARGSPAGPRAPGPRTSTAAASTRSAGRGAARSRRPRSARSRPPAADRRASRSTRSIRARRRRPEPTPSPAATPAPVGGAADSPARGPDRAGEAGSEADDRRAVAALAALAGAEAPDQRMRARLRPGPRRAAPPSRARG